MKAFCLFLILCTQLLLSQSGPRSWQDHLSINSSNAVAKLGKNIYASYYNGLIRFPENEISPQTLNKINGLNDVGIKLLRVNPYNNKLLVIYDNCNIDIIDAVGAIRNYPDFKLKILSGKKIVNEVTFFNQFAYLACGFGIVVFDTDKLEIKDTYIIGPGASDIDINQIALNDSLIFASSPMGIFKSNYRTRLLNNYKNWTLDTTQLPKGYYAGIINSNGTILCAYAPSKTNINSKGNDTLYNLVNNSWSKYAPQATQGLTINKLFSFGSMFGYFDAIGFMVRNTNSGDIVNYVNSFNGEVTYGTHLDAFVAKDHTGNLSYWIADKKNGLYQTYGYFPYFKQNKVKRNGTNSFTTGNIDVFKGKVAVSPSFIDNAGIGSYTREGLNIYLNNEWSYIPSADLKGDPIIDITSVLIDHKDSSRMFAASWYYGLIQYKNNKPIAVYNTTNIPTMPSILPGEPRCSGLSMDKDGNVWCTHSDQKGFLSVLRRNGQFINLTFEGIGARFTRKTFVDRNGFIWVLHEREGGITVVKHTNFTNFVGKGLSKDIGNGNLESNAVYSIAEDKDGKIWVGTAAGIRVFYNPSGIFTSSDFDAQPIKIVQDGNVELLLEKDIVTSIVVDGANNKWVGTMQGGLYCFSPDGQKQLYHFTKENSPLYSNTIVDINYNEATGDIFIGTEIGLQSFRSIILEGEENLTSVVAYPNPVKPNYQGSVLVKGLVDDCIVKITDQSGNLVWETKSTGGQIEWPVTTLAGNRVNTGVYVVYAANTTGELKTLTKILVVN